MLAIAGLPLSAGHGQMMHPPNWFMTDGLPRMCPMTKGASWDIGAMWYTNYTFAEKTTMDDDDPRRTFTDYSNSPGWGPGHYSPLNPWRYPGNAKVDSPCGGFGGNMYGCQNADGTPAPCVIGGFAFGPDARDYYSQGKLGQNVKRTRWQKGSVVEAAHILYSNHGGGYSYRLCKQSANVTEECFQAGHLDFVGDTHIIQWGPDKSTRKEISAVYTSNGTYPSGSMWARGPLPTCAGANGGFTFHQGLPAIDCEPYPWVPENRRKTQFPPPLPGLYGWGTDYTDRISHQPNHYMPYFIIDRLQVPSNLPIGNYVLSWRWDVEQGGQIWTTCADIELVPDPVDEADWAAWDDECAVWPPPSPSPPCLDEWRSHCDDDSSGGCGLCKPCIDRKTGPCEPCWASNATTGGACLYDDGHGCRACWAVPTLV